MNKKPTALITGASSGIGKELAHIHAAKGGDLVLVARSENRLNELGTQLQNQYGIKATVIALDLTAPDAAETLFQKTEAMNIQVDYLINNAGFGGHGKFHQRDLAAEHAMMQLNMLALTELSHQYLQGMVARGQGKILNIASTAAFLPGPLQAVYYATKSYVLSFSQAIAEELKGSGVTVTALCPGPVDTGFVKAGDLDGVELFKRAASASSVAQIGYKAMEHGKLVAFNERLLAFMLTWIVPLLPRKLVLTISRKTMEKTTA